MTDLQECAFFELVDKLRDIFGEVSIYSHHSFSNKACPSFDVVEFNPLFMGDIVVQVHQVFDDPKHARIGEGITNRIQYFGGGCSEPLPHLRVMEFFWV